MPDIATLLDEHVVLKHECLEKYSVTRATAYVNHVYFYTWDADWGPSFIRLCTYAPWSIRVWLNGHEWVKRQLERRGVDFTPLDNGIAAVDEPTALQRICDRLSAAHVQRYFDRWLSRLPSPFTTRNRRAGYVTPSPSSSWRSAAPRSSTAPSMAASSSRR